MNKMSDDLKNNECQNNNNLNGEQHLILDDLKLKLKKLDLFENDPEYFVYDYFAKLRNSVDIQRENLKFNIDCYSNGIIENINAIEIDCRKCVNKISRIVDDIEICRQNIEQLIKQFEIEDTNNKNHENSKINVREITRTNQKLTEKIKDFESYLLDYKSYEFEMAKVKNFKQIFGTFKVVDFQVITIFFFIILKFNLFSRSYQDFTNFKGKNY